MSSLTDTNVTTASGGLVELGYGEITSTVTVTTSSFTTPTTIIPDVTAVCDGGPILVEFFAPQTSISSGQSQIAFGLWEDGAEKHRYWHLKTNPTGSTGTDYDGVYAKIRLTPSAGSHTYRVTGASSPVNNQVLANNTTTGNSPAFLRVSKIVEATQWPAVTTGTIICTSTTRPSSPFEGQMIYETDTDTIYVYDGSSWNTIAPTAPTWTSYTPTLTLTSLSLTYAEQVGEYIVQDDWCTARFTMRISAVTGTHGVPYDWVVNLPVTPEISSGYTQNVGSMSNLHVYPAGYGVATCDATASSQNILFYLDSTSTVKIRTATHNTNKWSPSPTSGTPGSMVSGTLQYKV